MTKLIAASPRKSYVKMTFAEKRSVKDKRNEANVTAQLVHSYH